MQTKEQTTDLDDLLSRFARPHAARISCGPGWTPLLAELDKELARVSPDYKVHCVGSVLGEMVFSIVRGPSVEHYPCCTETFGPSAWPSRELSAREQLDVLGTHIQSNAHKDVVAANPDIRERNQQREELRTKQEALITHYKVRIESTCDVCGSPSSKEINALAMPLRCKTHGVSAAAS